MSDEKEYDLEKLSIYIIGYLGLSDEERIVEVTDRFLYTP